MHPDTIISGLRRELERLDRHASDHAERKAVIEAEIEQTDKLARPATPAGQPDTVGDAQRAYLAALGRELTRAAPERHAEIEQEIVRVEQALRSRPAPEASQEAPETIAEADSDGDAVQLDAMTKAQLHEHAANLGVRVPPNATKAEILELLLPPEATAAPEASQEAPESDAA